MEELTQALVNKNCFLFAGSGVCVDAGLPSWHKLVLDTINESPVQ